MRSGRKRAGSLVLAAGIEWVLTAGESRARVLPAGVIFGTKERGLEK
jgi:hypothetical protein